MNLRSHLLLLVFFLLARICTDARAARETVVEVSATVQLSPPQISLSWLPTTFPIALQKVFRKAKGAALWTDVATLSSSATAFVDNTGAVGLSYEYFVVRIFSSGDPGSASGYVNAGIRFPLTAVRGRILIVVDDTISTALTPELDVFVSDLVGDGWVVARQDVPRNGTALSTKAIIQSMYNADPVNTRSLILLGHIPVPYSGDINPDGHPEHRGAWPADAYYADMDGVWTDSTINNPGAARLENRNIPGDGKFDQSNLPSDVELEIGRIDLANLPSASPTPAELDLLRQYLNRNHAFRFRTGGFASIPRRGLIADNFGYFGGEAFAASGWRNFTSFFGSGVGGVVPQSWFPTLENDSYLCAYGCGPGNYGGAGGIGSTGDFATKKCLSVFNLLFGSYFGDWDVGDSFLRAPLAGRSDSLGLVSMWAGRPHWHLYHMAMGETVGYAARTTMNNTGFSTGGYVLNAAGYGVHVAMMGDPTLRLHPVLPPTNLVIGSSSGSPVLTWTASMDSGIESYIVLRANSPAGPFDRVGETLAAGTAFTDRSGVPGQTYHYQLRAVKLETSASGTYLNGSQGVYGTGSFTGPVVREIQVTGNGKTIPNDEIAASVTSGTDFSSAEATVQSVTHTFAIANEGTGDLALTGSPVVQINGPNAADFSVVAQPANVVGSGGNVVFQITFSPSAPGLRTATVSIASDDLDEGNYQYAIRGIGLDPAPEINISPTTIPMTVAANVPVVIGNTGAGTLQHTVSNSHAEYSSGDSNSFGGPEYAWIEISATGNEITGFSNPDDAMSGAIPIGFDFPFCGNTFNSLRVSTNAFISFGSASPLFFGIRLPSIEAPGNIIAAFWNDLILDAGSHIYTQQIGDLFVIQFENIPRFGAETERITCEIVLRQSGEILLQYKQVPTGFTDYSIGIQDGLRSKGLQIAYHENYVETPFAVRIVPPGYYTWLGSSVISGNIAPGGSQTFDATANASGLPPGQYSASLYVNSNDADERQSSIHVQLTVPGAEAEVLGNGLSISPDDATPMLTDGTDFGMAAIDGGSVSRTFTIRNSGADPLTVSGLVISGAGFSVTTPPPGSVAVSASANFVVTFAPTLAGAVTGAISFSTNDADESAFNFGITARGLSPVESWRLTHFHGIANAEDGADAADPDRDGLPNLVEYGLTLDPKAPGSSSYPVVRVNGGGYLEIVFSRNTSRTDLTYTTEASSNLVTWSPIASSTGGASVVISGAHSAVEFGGGEVRMVTVEDSQPAGSGSPRFLRVKISRN